MDQPDMRRQCGEFVYSSLERTRALLERSTPCKTSSFGVAVLELPIFAGDSTYNTFFEWALSSGYRSLNVGLTSLWEGRISVDILNDARKRGLSISSVHGTSIKRAIKNKISYSEILKRDRDTLSIIDPGKSMVINYDLFAGHLPSLVFSESFEQTYEDHVELLCSALGISSDNPYFLSEYIIKQVSGVFKDTYKISFEIPGTKGWSLLTPIDEGYLSFLDNAFHAYLPNAQLTIDLAHLLTWTKDIDMLMRIHELFRRYQQRIGMLHICSADSDDEKFVALYKSVHKNKYPDWHIRALDVSLFVCEDEMVDLIGKFREYVDHPFLEVSETRLPSVTIADYFPEYTTTQFDHLYKEGLLMQGKLLGYSSL